MENKSNNESNGGCCLYISVLILIWACIFSLCNCTPPPLDPPQFKQPTVHCSIKGSIWHWYEATSTSIGSHGGDLYQFVSHDLILNCEVDHDNDSLLVTPYGTHYNKDFEIQFLGDNSTSAWMVQDTGKTLIVFQFYLKP